MFICGWMEWTGVCRWELIHENDQTRTSEIQNTIKSSKGTCRLTIYSISKIRESWKINILY
jgi:hypothetical protein